MSEGPRSVWLFHDAAHAVFEAARRRVYLVRLPSQQQQPPPGKKKAGGAGRGGRGRAAAARGGARAGKAARGRGGVQLESSLAGEGAGAVDGEEPGEEAAGASAAQGGGGRGVAVVEPVLEQPPKWGLLRQVRVAWAGGCWLIWAGGCWLIWACYGGSEGLEEGWRPRVSGPPLLPLLLARQLRLPLQSRRCVCRCSRRCRGSEQLPGSCRWRTQRPTRTLRRSSCQLSSSSRSSVGIRPRTRPRGPSR